MRFLKKYSKWIFYAVVFALGLSGFYYLKDSFRNFLSKINPATQLGAYLQKPVPQAGSLSEATKEAEKKYVNDLLAKGQRPSVWDTFKLYLDTLNPFRSL
jgi:hypothetical protein